MSFHLPYSLENFEKKPPFLRRLNTKIKVMWQKTPFYYLTLLGRFPQNLKIIPLDPWPGDTSHGRFLLEGKMLIDSQGTSINLTELWGIKNLTPPQLAYLHSFDYLRDLRAVGDNMARRLARQFIVLWIEKNSNWRSFAWRPEITGYRIASWIGLYDFFCASADETFRRLFFKSLSRQLRHLASTWQNAPSLTYKFYGLFGLIIGTIGISYDEQKIAKLLNSLENLLQGQVHEDGGHISRSPLMQLNVLRMLIDLRSILRAASLPVPPEVHRSINKMAPLVRLLRHGDGKLASFGGESPFSASFIDMVLSLADVRGKPPLRAGSMGFERCTTKSGLILLNAAPALNNVLPKTFEPGTGILNFEWSMGRERLVTCGDLIIQTSQDLYLKANIPEPLLFVHRKAHHKDMFMEATYHSTQVTPPFLHRRQLYLNGTLPDLRGEDYIETQEGSIFAVRFMLSPHLEISPSSTGKMVVIRLGDGRTLKFSAAGHEQLYCCPNSEGEKSPYILVIGNLLDKKTAAIKWAFREM